MTDDIVAATATALAGVLLIPQIVRLLRTRETAGVAVTWAALGCVGNATWAVYLGITGVWLAAIAPALAVLAYALIVGLVAPTSGGGWLPLSLTYLVGLIAIGHFGGLGRLGVTLAIVPAVHVAPQVAEVYREANPIGMSPSTWILSVAAAGLWMVYGSMVGSVAVTGYGLVRGSVSGLVLFGWWMTNRPSRRVASGDVGRSER